MMIKNLLFAAALLSLALAGGCATGGNGVVPPQPAVTVTITSPADANPNAIYPTQSVMLTANATNTTTTAVTWGLGPAVTCTRMPNPCGTLTPVTPAPTPATANYVAPATPISGVVVTATLAADTSVSGPLAMTVVDVTTDVAPMTLSVGSGLTQQFTAVAVPDDAPQTFTWTCNTTVKGTVTGSCANFVQDSNVSGLAYYTYTAADSGSTGVQISAVSPLDTAGCSKNCTIANATLVTSRVNGTYAFRFSGYDANKKATAMVGTFTALNGTISSGGVEDELTPSGWAQNSITGGLYTPTSSDPNNSNNAGTLTLTLPAGVYPSQFQVVLDGAGDIEMIEADGHGTGSGIAQKSASSSLFTGSQVFAFGFTGVDSGGDRVGYVGLLPTNGSAIVGGQMDVNDNGGATNICGAGPCSITNATYTPLVCNCGWHMTLTPGLGAPMDFDFFISSGTTTNKANPLTFFAISTDPISTNPAVSGTMVLQTTPPSGQTYNNAFFKGTSVSALTGTVTAANATCAAPPCANVSLTLGTTDGNGNFSGQFDQNNAGAILSYPSSTQSPFAYTYAADPSNNGRYMVQMLGNPGANPVVKPLPFVLYASGANRGFLLDQSSSSVMTGTMNPQGPAGEGFSGSELPGILGAATTASGSSAVTPIAANLIVTYPGFAAPGAPPIPNPYVVAGTQYPPYTPPLQAVAGTYTVSLSGTGTIALTAPPLPVAANYVIYVLGTSGCSSAQSPVCAIQSFFMMDEDTTNPDASIIFAQQ